MKLRQQLLQPGVLAALLAALLFGAGTPLAKLLLTSLNPWLLAGLLYLGSGLGMTLYRVITGAQRVHLARNEWPWLLGAVLSGGVVAPVSRPTLTTPGAFDRIKSTTAEGSAAVLPSKTALPFSSRTQTLISLSDTSNAT